ncbi:MAG: flavin-dependent oxidoreductase [Saprospiraceae bacterium]|nr:flavin-dependent oxidoreductase [Saprospiraceae bacterium]
MKIIIAGGGIGGLVAALSLHKAGFEVKIFESVKEIKPLGVGINLLPHSIRVLTNLGLESKIAENAVETKDLVYANRHGQLFWEEPRGRFAGYKWAQYSVHRGNLQMLLFDEVQRVIGAENIKTNHHLQEFDDVDNGILATFIDRETGKVQCHEHGDILIGADGISSVVRQKLYPTEGGVKYSGNVLYRGTTLMKPFLTGASMAMIGNLKQKMVVYPIENTLNTEGYQLTNWVGNLKEDNGDNSLKVRDWNRQADKNRLLDIYKNWRFDWLDVPAMMAGAENIYEFPMSDRDPLPRWTFGRVTLLGDAAHPMYPIGSNGASQAILDADALANALIEEADIDTALKRYDEERVPATTKVVLQNRQKGPDFIMDLMEERFPDGFSDGEIPHEELANIMEHYKQVAGFDIKTLNEKT